MLEWFRDEKMRNIDFEIALVIHEVVLLKDLLEDLREAIVCKPLQYKRLLGQVEKQIEEVYFRARYCINSLKKEAIRGDQ